MALALHCSNKFSKASSVTVTANKKKRINSRETQSNGTGFFTSRLFVSPVYHEKVLAFLLSFYYATTLALFGRFHSGRLLSAKHRRHSSVTTPSGTLRNLRRRYTPSRKRGHKPVYWHGKPTLLATKRKKESAKLCLSDFLFLRFLTTPF